jgi:hypothetical protein
MVITCLYTTEYNYDKPETVTATRLIRERWQFVCIAYAI